MLVLYLKIVCDHFHILSISSCIITHAFLKALLSNPRLNHPFLHFHIVRQFDDELCCCRTQSSKQAWSEEEEEELHRLYQEFTSKAELEGDDGGGGDYICARCMYN
jgi:hypothetical protein